jgi:hypothetical protein
MRFRKTCALVAMVTGVALLAATPALAHECFNTQRADQASAMIAQHSHGWFDIQTYQLLGIFTGTCDPSAGQCLPVPPQFSDLAAFGVSDPNTLIGVLLGFAPPSALPPAVAAEFPAWVSFLQSAAAAAAQMGVPTHYLTLNNATAAGGAVNSNQNITANGKGIDHFPDVYGNQLVAAYMSVL